MAGFHLRTKARRAADPLEATQAAIREKQVTRELFSVRDSSFCWRGDYQWLLILQIGNMSNEHGSWIN